MTIVVSQLRATPAVITHLNTSSDISHSYRFCRLISLERRSVIHGFAVGLLARFHRHGQLVFLPRDRVFAAIDEIGSRLAKFRAAATHELFALIRLAAKEIFALVSLRPQNLARLFTRPRSHQHPNRDANAHTNDKVTYSTILLSHITAPQFLGIRLCERP